MNREDAIRAVNAWLDETLAEAKVDAAQHVPMVEIEARVYSRLVSRAHSFGLALTDDEGGSLPA